MDAVRQIAEAVLYEGYLLWPYRASAMKNQQRFTFGCVHPKAFSDHGSDADRCEIQLQCLLEAGPAARLDLQLRFLHLLRRRPAVLRGERLEELDVLTVGGERHVAWDEAREREVEVAALLVEELDAARTVPVEVLSGEDREELGDGGVILRSWERLEGALEVGARQLRPGLTRLTVRFRNTAGWQGHERAAALGHSFLSAHIVVRATGAALVSSTDPPPETAAAANTCRNLGLWPVLVGEPGARDTVLAAPIVLSDYPRIAPESPGDHFDGTEIDELLVHSILALTDDEKREMRETDPRTRAILERTAALTPEQLMRLHGAIREMTPVEDRRGELG